MDFWWQVLTAYAGGAVDAEDLFAAIDEWAGGGRPTYADVPTHEPDLLDAEEAALVAEQARVLTDLLNRFWRRELTRDELADEVLDVLGLAPD